MDNDIHKPIRVLHCIYALQGGGAETQLQILVANSNPASVRHAVFYCDGCGIERDYAHGQPVELIQCAESRHSLAFLKRLRSVIRNSDADIVHVWLPTIVTIPAMCLARWYKKRVVFSYRCQMHFRHWNHRLEWWVARLCAHRVVSNSASNSVLPEFERLFVSKQGVIIPNAIRPTACQWEAREREGPFQLVTAGRLITGKNLSGLISALEALSVRRPDLKWVLRIYGEGEEQANLEQHIVASNMEDKISLCGFSTDLASVLAKADGFVFPSLTEGMPNVLMEALALGVPTIASRIPANLAVIQGDVEPVLWFDPNSVSQLTDVLTILMAMPQPVALQYSKAAKQSVSQFSVKRYVKNYQCFYASVL